MISKRRRIRELSGDTFENALKNPEFWLNQALMFNSSATVLFENSETVTIVPCLLNAGISLELAVKAILVARGSEPPKTHNLNNLSRSAAIDLSSHEQATLELLTEVIIWLGKYPVPTREDDWHRYRDEILEKHLIRERDGLTGRTITNNETFPTSENYSKLWDKFMHKFTEVLENET